MNTEAIVNAANEQTTVGIGCDSAKLGDAFITPCFNLAAKYIIHVVVRFISYQLIGDH